jgi:hypothetical protein
MPATRSLPNSTQSGNTRPCPDVPGLSTAHISPRGSDRPHITRAVGGSYAEISFGRRPGRPGGGGPRGEITEFSKASRRRLLRLLNSINRDEADLPYFVTLTYHHAWPEDRRGRNAHLEAFRKRLERVYGQFSAVWRLEFQKRGAPHYHLLMWLPVPPAKHRLAVLRQRIAAAWTEIAGYGSTDHARAGTKVEIPRSWRGVNSYAAKYMGKLEQLQGGTASVGRFWGTWRREMLPISWVTCSLTISGAFRLRRVLRSFSGQRSTHQLHRMGVFVGSGTVSRLLEFYGYYRA